jgi:hypothetical protein
MRSLSTRVLDNICQVYAPIQGQDTDGGPQWTYAGIPTLADQPCSTQAQEIEELIDDQNRVTRYLRYKVMFGSPINLRPRSKITYVDAVGVTRILFAQVTRDEAGRGAAFVVRAVERI